MKKYITIFILCIPIFIYSQGEANNWFFGTNAGLNFNSGTVTTTTGSLSTYEGCSSFSDKDGNLLFYSDGTTVWNKNHNPMPNGNGTLKGHPSSTQSAIIVPNPGNSDLYYIFTVGAWSIAPDGETYIPTEGLNSYVVNMTLNGGLGDIQGTKTDLSDGLNSSWSEKVTSVKGAECNTYWVISLVDRNFYAYKIDKTGLNKTPVISVVDYLSTNIRGYLKVSPDGKKLASATFTQGRDSEGNNVIGNGKLHLYSFNDTTGEVSNNGVELISNAYVDGAPYGVEFSPNSTKLYTTTHNGINNKLFQFDLDAINIPNSKILIKQQTGYRGALQLAPNGKIYATVPVSYKTGTGSLDIIHAPDKVGLDCNYQIDGLFLNGLKAMQGLPPFIASLLLPIEITDGSSITNLNNTTAKRCIGEDFLLQPQNIEGSPTYTWTFNGTPVSYTADLSLPNLSKTDEGIYYLEAETVDDCGFKITYTGEVEIEVYQPPAITKPSNILQCDDDNNGSFDFDLKLLKDSEVLNGQDASTFEVIYFSSQNDADLNQYPLSNPYTFSAGYTSEIIYARIHNKNNNICYETESFTIELFELPNPATSIVNYSVCDTNINGTDIDGFEEFDLRIKETEILNGQSATDFKISYYTDVSLASEITSPSNFKNTKPNIQEIYVLVESNFNNLCSATTSFNIEVSELPTINPYFVLKQCDEDGIKDLATDFNLNEANDFISNDSTNVVTYFESYSNADSNTSPILSFPHSNSYLNKVFARIENTNGCHRVAEIDLLVSDTSFPANYLNTITECDDDDTIDGIREFNLTDYDLDFIAEFPSGQNLTVSYFRNLTDATNEENEITSPYLNESPFNQTLFVRVESEDNGECFGFGPYLNLLVESRPEFELPESAIYCQNLPYVEVTITNPLGIYNYKWFDSNNQIISTNSNAFIKKEGIYTVIATSIAGCISFEHTITIEPSIIASISENDITVIDDSENNSISISTTNLGIGDYEFSLDDIDGIYQDNPYFDMVEPGIHTVYIRDKNNCGIASIDIAVIGYPKFFTPNNDGYNDTWQIQGVNESFYASSNIYIFDRYGKLITQIDPKGNGWNGLFNGEFLPSTDYWFSVELIDNNGNIRIRKGHFSLIRR